MNLLYPNGKEKSINLSEEAYRNLALEEIVDMIAVTDNDRNIVRSVFNLLPQDIETIRFRQEIIKDFIDNVEICDKLGEILKKIDVLKEYRLHNHYVSNPKSSLWDLIDYISEMDVYVQVIEELNSLFDECEITSKGLAEVKKILKDVIDMDRIEELKEIVEKLHMDMSTLRSVTVGINLDPDLRPEEVQILSSSPLPYKSMYKNKVALGLSMASQKIVKYNEQPSQLMKAMAKDMERELSKAVKKDKAILNEYINLKGYFLLDICNDLKFLLLVARYGRKLNKKGYSISYPTINNGKSVKISGVYNLRLTEKAIDNIVKNDFEFSENEKVFILTGPNRGGKTMLTQAVGLAAFFASQGLFVNADSYEGFVFEDILTHFPADENESLDLGRLGEEAVRIREIVKKASPKTLVLLNETYSSTSAVDGLFLAKDLVHILKHKGIPTIFNTHLHDLARQTDEMNEWDGEGKIVSLSMEIVNNVNTYRVLRKEPDSSSFAKNIALKYGVTYEQMLEQ